MRKATGNYRTYSISSKTAAFFPEFAVDCLRQNYSPGSCACCEGPALGQNTIYFLYNSGRRVIGISGSLIWSTPSWNRYLTPVVNFGKVRRAQLAKSSHLTSTMVPLGSFNGCSDAKERLGCGKQRKATAPIHP